MKKWLPLLLVLLFTGGAIAALLLLPEQAQGPAGLAMPRPTPTAAHGAAILPRESSDDEIAPRNEADADGDEADSGETADGEEENRNILAPRQDDESHDEGYPTPFAKPDNGN